MTTTTKTVKLVPSTDVGDILEMAADDNIRMLTQHNNEMKRKAAAEMQQRRERRKLFLDRALDTVLLAAVIFGLAVALSCLL